MKSKWIMEVLTKRIKYGNMKKGRLNEENSLQTGFDPNAPLVTEDMALDYLSDLLVEVYLDQKQNEGAK